MKSVYVIMPINSDPQAMQKQHLLSTLALRFQLQLYLPLYKKDDAAFNLTKTLAMMRGASFVFADLSLARPSCYYELGLAEALGKKIYPVAENGTDIHQTAVRSKVKYYADLNDFGNVAQNILDDATMN